MQAKDRFGWSGTEKTMDEKVEEPTAVTLRQQTKVCPRCGQTLFADMNVCYGCLYDFARGQHEPTLDAHVEAGPPSQQDTVDHAREVAVLVRTGDVDVVLAIPALGLRIGRAPTNDIVLHSKAVSREHVLLMPASDGMVVSDLGSTNPPLFHGQPVDGNVLVPFGESFVLCGSHFEAQQR